MYFITDDTTVTELRATFKALGARFSCTSTLEGIQVTLNTCVDESIHLKGDEIAEVLDHALQIARVAYYKKVLGEMLVNAKNLIQNDANDECKRAKGYILDALGTLSK